ncbi:uncharacterized protein Pyn_01264 [Prunus yedoensis var. nudiflora]|uniref:Uncharacterized protein n=1 Tax=Prunus yedoensis var. nudiflora TaxID=2094558 RepID=A0A314XM55_PRUYE|nr:uncharacterized protein Pyn_01264 [Prunus yedoensis var. nudiflora]
MLAVKTVLFHAGITFHVSDSDYSIPLPEDKMDDIPGDEMDDDHGDKSAPQITINLDAARLKKAMLDVKNGVVGAASTLFTWCRQIENGVLTWERLDRGLSNIDWERLVLSMLWTGLQLVSLCLAPLRSV